MLRKLQGVLQRWSMRRDKSAYERQRAKISDTLTAKGHGAQIRLIQEWKPQLTFQHYRTAMGEQVRYQGYVARASTLLADLAMAHSLMFKAEPSVSKVVQEPAEREYSLDYFLTNEDNRVLHPSVVFEQIYVLMTDINVLMMELQQDEPTLYSYYDLKYQSLLDNAALALDCLIQVSDLFISQPNE